MKLFSRRGERGRWVHEESSSSRAVFSSTPGSDVAQGPSDDSGVRVVEPPASLVRVVRQVVAVVVVTVALAASCSVGRGSDADRVQKQTVPSVDATAGQTQEWATMLGVPDALTVVAGVYTRGGLCAGPTGEGVVCESLFVVYADGHAETLSRSVPVEPAALQSLIEAYEQSQVPSARPGATAGMCQSAVDGTDVAVLLGPGRMPAALRTGSPSVGPDTAQVISGCDYVLNPGDPLLVMLDVVRKQTLT